MPRFRIALRLGEAEVDAHVTADEITPGLMDEVCGRARAEFAALVATSAENVDGPASVVSDTNLTAGSLGFTGAVPDRYEGD